MGEKDDKKNELGWQPHGPVCLKCGAPNPDNHDICGGCGEKATEFKDGDLPKEQHNEREMIKKALKFK